MADLDQLIDMYQTKKGDIDRLDAEVRKLEEAREFAKGELSTILAAETLTKHDRDIVSAYESYQHDPVISALLRDHYQHSLEREELRKHYVERALEQGELEQKIDNDETGNNSGATYLTKVPEGYITSADADRLAGKGRNTVGSQIRRGKIDAEKIFLKIGKAMREVCILKIEDLRRLYPGAFPEENRERKSNYSREKEDKDEGSYFYVGEALELTGYKGYTSLRRHLDLEGGPIITKREKSGGRLLLEASSLGKFIESRGKKGSKQSSSADSSPPTQESPQSPTTETSQQNEKNGKARLLTGYKTDESGVVIEVTSGTRVSRF